MMGNNLEILDHSGIFKQNYDFNVLKLSDGTVQLIKKWHWNGFEERITLSDDEWQCMGEMIMKSYSKVKAD
jgi:hypothetical protein